MFIFINMYYIIFGYPNAGVEQVLAKILEKQFYCTLKKEYSYSFYYVYSE